MSHVVTSPPGAQQPTEGKKHNSPHANALSYSQQQGGWEAKNNPSRPKLKAGGSVDGQGTLCSLVRSDGAIAPCPSSTRNRPCCDERNTHLLWRRGGLLPFRCGPVRASPSLARFASLESPSKCPFSTKPSPYNAAVPKGPAFSFLNYYKTDCCVVSGSGFGERAQTENRDVRVAPGFGL